MSSPKEMTYWMACAIENRNPTMTDKTTGLKTPHGSKAYLDIQANFATYSGTWEKCADKNADCTCNGLVRYGKNPWWTTPKTISGPTTCNSTNFGNPIWGILKTCECQKEVYFTN